MRPHVSRSRATKIAPASDSATFVSVTQTPIALDRLHALKCETEKCSLQLPENLSEDGWLAIGSELVVLDTRLSWWIGDWWACGQHRYGERIKIVASNKWHGPSRHTCENIARVCRAFETSRRRELLSLAHHDEVAALDHQAADSLLDWCEESIATSGRPRSVRALRDEKWRRQEPATNVLPARRVPVAISRVWTPPIRITADVRRVEAPTKILTLEVTKRDVPFSVLPAVSGPPGTREHDADQRARTMVATAIRDALQLPVSADMRTQLQTVAATLDTIGSPKTDTPISEENLDGFIRDACDKKKLH